MRASLLLVCAVVSAGLLAQPADARSRGDERREQRQDQRQDQRDQQRAAQRDERRDERREPQRPDGWRDDRGARGDQGDRSADAARRAQQRNGGGRVLSVEPEGAGYRVKVLKDGEVRTHHVDVED